MAGFSTWLKAFRLHTLPLATGCVILGTFIPEVYTRYSPLIFALTFLTAILLQVISNLANDYGDFKKGTDNENRLGPKRMMQTGAISRYEMQRMLWILIGITIISGIMLLWKAFGLEGSFTALIMFAVGLFAIWAAVRYTLGNKPYGYVGLGDIFVIFFFGIVGVAGTAFLQTKDVPIGTLLLGLSYGCLSAGVLNINNLRDIENDKASGKITLAAKLGRKQAVLYQFLLICIALGASLLYLVSAKVQPLAYLSLAGLVPAIINTTTVWQRRNNPAGLNPLLKGLSLSILFYALLFVALLNCFS